MTCRQKIDCWCTVCHQERFQRIQRDALNLQDVLRKFNLHEKRESKKLETVFNEVLNTTVYAKLAKELINRTTGYKNIKSYFKNIYPHEEDTILQGHADAINHAVKVYDDIGKIYANIVQVRNVFDIRRLSLNMLFEARSLNWCYDYAEKIRGRKRRRPDDLEYDEQDFQDLLNIITQHPCYQAVSNDKHLLAALSNRLGAELLKRAR